MADITMPQLGETVTEGTITRWFKQVGESVAADEVLFEVSTDKVDSEVPSPVAGTLVEIRAGEGDTVAVGQVLAVVESAGAGVTPPPAAPPAPEVAPEPAPEPAAAPAAVADMVLVPTPAAPEPAPPAAPEPAPPAAPEPAAPAAPEPVTAPAEPDAAPSGADTAGLLLSPVVRKLIDENGIDVAALSGTGLGGRITRADVERAILERSQGAPSPPPAAPALAQPAAPAPAQPAPAASPPPAAPAPAPVVVASGRDTVLPMSNIRRRTAEHMVMTKQVSPHVLTAVEVDFEGVERVRTAHKGAWKQEEGFSLTYLPFIARAVCDAIRDYPHLNASVGDSELIIHGDVNLAIAVDLDFQGLLAPVVKGADSKRLRAIAREVVDLAGRARSKKLSADEIMGGTFTITNPGQYGTLMQFPLINQPQVAILSTDGIRRKPVVVTDSYGNESIAIHSVGILALAWDHRAFDGAYVAAFMDHLRTIIESRDWEPELQ